MGWCSGTEIFDVVAKHVTKKHLNRDALLEELIGVMWDHDWDCECESEYVNHPLIRKAFLNLDPNTSLYDQEDE